MSPDLPPVELTSVHEAPLYVKLFTWGVLAGMGGAVKFVAAALRSKDTMQPQRFLILLAANVFISGFSGLMGSLAFSTLSPDRTLQLVAAGVFGYLGTQTLDLITLVMQKKAFGHPGPVSAVVPIPPSVDPGQTQA